MEGKYSRELIEPGRWHVSVAMLRITTEEGIATARRVMQDFNNLGLGAGGLPKVTFQGVGEFQKGRVAFVTVAEGDEEPLVAFISTVRARLTEAGVHVLPDEIHPHLTVAKHRGEGKNVNMLDLRNFHHAVFGTQAVTSLDLCSHFLPKSPETGYYWSF